MEVQLGSHSSKIKTEAYLYEDTHQTIPFANWVAYPHLTEKKKQEYLEEQEMWESYEQSKTVLPPDMV